MPSLSVRKLDKKIYDQLRILAATHGVSMEEEVRLILSHAVSIPERITDIFHKHFGTENGIDLEVLHKRKPHEPLDFNK